MSTWLQGYQPVDPTAIAADPLEESQTSASSAPTNEVRLSDGMSDVEAPPQIDAQDGDVRGRLADPKASKTAKTLQKDEKSIDATVSSSAENEAFPFDRRRSLWIGSAISCFIVIAAIICVFLVFGNVKLTDPYHSSSDVTTTGTGTDDAMTDDTDTSGPQWQQIGQVVNSEHGDFGGWDISLSGDASTIAIGAWTGHGEGHTRVFRNNNKAKEWRQLGEDIDAGDPQSGWAVSLSNDGGIVAIGSPYADTNADDSLPAAAGHIRIFQWTSLNWFQLGDAIEGKHENDNAGYSVSLSADGYTVALGSPGFRDSQEKAVGQVRVFRWPGIEWEKVGKPIHGDVDGGLMGTSVALNADASVLISGAPANTNFVTGTMSGLVQVYAFDDEEEDWVKRGPPIVGLAPGDLLGSAVDISDDGHKVAVGSRGANDGAGEVRIYAFTGFFWFQMGEAIQGSEAGAAFGSSLSMSADGSVVVVGAPGANDATGETRSFEWKEEQWEPLALTIDGEKGNDNSGRSVAISSDASRVVVGALFQGGEDNSNAGYATVYDLDMFL